MNSSKVQSGSNINVIILDITPQTWLRAGVEAFQSVIDSVAGYCRSLLLMNSSSEVAVIAVYPGSAEFVWISSSSAHSSIPPPPPPPSSSSSSSSSSPSTQPTPVQTKGATKFFPYSTETKVVDRDSAVSYVSYTDDKTFSATASLESRLKERISKLGSVIAAGVDAQSPFPSLDIGLSKALCFINRKRVDFDTLARNIHVVLGSPVEARILCVCASPDSNSQYVPVMNAVFAAQKDKVPIDTCFLTIVSPPSTYLKNASYITENSVYLEHNSFEGLLQLMICSFSPSLKMREKLYLPTVNNIETSAPCFCHHVKSDKCFICSICLSILCEETKMKGICPICKSKFT